MLKMIRMRDVFATRDEALDTLGNGKMLIRLKEKDGMWCLTWLEPKKQ